VIESFRHKGLRNYWTKGQSRGLNPQWIRRIANRLQALDSATAPEDLNLPGYGFHGLEGADRWALTITANFRLTFGWRNDRAVDVDLEDYH
jgi:proteic killer suppression protein